MDSSTFSKPWEMIIWTRFSKESYEFWIHQVCTTHPLACQFPIPTEYIFPLPRNAFTREGTGVKIDFFFREKVSLSPVVGKKDGCLTDCSSCLPKRSKSIQRREVKQSFWPETEERESSLEERKNVWDCTFLPQVHTIGIIGGFVFFPNLEFVQP